MFKTISCWIAQITDKTICWDITENRGKKLKEFDEIFEIKEPEKFKYYLTKFQAKSAIEDKYATEKNNRIIIVLTFVLTFLTLVLLFK